MNSEFRTLSLVTLFAFAATLAGAAPRIECDAPVYNFGTLIEQDEIIHKFTIWNRGDSKLKISKVRACCGMKASMDSMEIAPGSNSICRVVFNMATRQGEQNKQVLLGSNDPQQPYFDLRLKGVRQTAFKITPEAIRFGNLTAGKAQAQRLSVTNGLDPPVTLQAVSSNIKNVEAEIVESADRSWVIQVIAKPMTAQDRLNGTIHLDFSSGRVNVPFSGTVASVIKSVPERITILSDSEKHVDRQVMLSSSDGRAFKIVSAELVHAEGTVGTRQLRLDRWQCSLSVLPSSITADAALHILSSCEEQPEIIIPLELKTANP
jgi:hypothetical protein